MYIHSENPLVLSVSPSSPLSGYLSHGDVIESLDGLPIHSSQDWADKMVLLDDQTFQEPEYSKSLRSPKGANGRKGYCVPHYLVEKNLKIEPVDGLLACPDELAAFRSTNCYNLSSIVDDSSNFVYNRTESAVCLPANAVVKLSKCGDGWVGIGMDGNCPCSEDEECLLPVQMPGSTWVEVTFSRPYSSDCLHQGESSSVGLVNQESRPSNCGGTFVYVGDVRSEAYSVWLTSYRQRFFISSSIYIPSILEKILAYTIHVSATLALLNVLPVFLLDGESILEVCLNCITWMSTQRRRRVLQICLLSGSCLSILNFSWIFFSTGASHYSPHVNKAM